MCRETSSIILSGKYRWPSTSDAGSHHEVTSSARRALQPTRISIPSPLIGSMFRHHVNSSGLRFRLPPFLPPKLLPIHSVATSPVILVPAPKPPGQPRQLALIPQCRRGLSLQLSVAEASLTCTLSCSPLLWHLVPPRPLRCILCRYSAASMDTLTIPRRTSLH